MGERFRKGRTIFASSRGPVSFLPRMTTACVLPAGDLHESGALSLVAPAALSPLDRVLQPCHH